MKKVKLIIMATAILLSVGGAFATGLRFDCRFNPQFYFNGSGYLPAGRIGVDYACEGGLGNCTYIQVGNNWQACQVGTFVMIPGINNK
jgi:hypothetical protein